MQKSWLCSNETSLGCFIFCSGVALLAVLELSVSSTQYMAVRELIVWRIRNFADRRTKAESYTGWGLSKTNLEYLKTVWARGILWMFSPPRFCIKQLLRRPPAQTVCVVKLSRMRSKTVYVANMTKLHHVNIHNSSFVWTTITFCFDLSCFRLQEINFSTGFTQTCDF